MMIKSETNTIPRRAYLNRLIKQELIIHNAIQEVEKLGAHTLLTDAVILLGQAKDKVSDYVDSQKLVYPDQSSLKEWMDKHGLKSRY